MVNIGLKRNRQETMVAVQLNGTKMCAIGGRDNETSEMLTGGKEGRQKHHPKTDNVHKREQKHPSGNLGK